MNLTYVNKKNKKVNVIISAHAKKRFIERFNRVFPETPILNSDSVEKQIYNYWNRAVLKPIKIKERIKKYNNNTLYFVSDYFRFVVENSTIITIELCSKNTKHLNHKPRKEYMNVTQKFL
ncbi:hypothetical protein M0Q39_05090 [Patescibacteria group bacterium]|nr:hypothetical protein [Patescibacteria group bacterium]